MPELHLEHTEMLAAREKHGVLEEVRLLARITGLTSTSYNVLWEAAATLGIAAGSTLEAVSPYLYGQNPFLVLTERNPGIHGNDPSQFDIELVYQSNMDNQNLGNPFNQTIYGHHRSTVRQIETDHYRELDSNPLSSTYGQIIQRPIVVGHRYQFPHYRAGDPEVQYGKVNVFQPERSVRYEGYIDTTDPWNLERLLVASINSAFWMNEQARTWMCSEVEWWLKGGTRYQFQFEFQHNPEGWDPTAAFVDDSGKHPYGLAKVDGFYGLMLVGDSLTPTPVPAGVFTVPWHRRLNYSLLFQAYFEGFQALSV